jgi:hypothetical protein
MCSKLQETQLEGICIPLFFNKMPRVRYSTQPYFVHRSAVPNPLFAPSFIFAAIFLLTKAKPNTFPL